MPAGRPKVAEQRTQTLRLRTTQAERDQLAAAAQAAGVPIARWAREALLTIANNTDTDTDTDTEE